MEDRAADITECYYPYFPPGVTEIIAMGSNTYIGEVDKSTVFKYPHAPGDMTRLDMERKLLETIGPHERIISLKGSSDTGLYLERARNGNIGDYLSGNPLASVKQRLAWCREAAEAVTWIHSRRILHCDLHPWNLLFDEDLHDTCRLPGETGREWRGASGWLERRAYQIFLPPR